MPNTQTKKIINIEQWTTAFLRFAAINGLKFPKEMSKLMKYAEIVRDLANRKPGLSWLMYGIQFRCLRQSIRISWDQLHTEFWVMAATTSTFRPQRRQQQPFPESQSTNQPRPQFLRNTCWTYNRFGRCNKPDCHFDHKCGYCRGRHCAKSCQTSNQVSGPSQNGPDPQQSGGQTTKPNRPTKEVKQSKSFPVESKVVTPIKVNILASYLGNYSQYAYLVEGFTFGFRLGYSGQRQFCVFPNMSTCQQCKDVISQKIKAEVALGRLKGPFQNPPFKNMQISPIGCVPKKSTGDFRLIHHLSYPFGTSINDGISSELSTVSYCSFDDAIDALLKLGKGALMCKTDIESAFRLIPVHHSDHELLSYKWQSQFYYDSCLPFGCRSSPAIFERFSTAVEWIAQKHLNIPDIIHILDDFFMIGPPASEKCSNFLSSFLTFCQKVGIPIKAEKQ